MHIGTILRTWIKGEHVGTDEFGNNYYRSKKKNRWGRESRWCLFDGNDEASMVPPEWSAWLHHTVDKPLTNLSTKVNFWQKQHIPNMTGTDQAYRPPGHLVNGGKRSRATGDYEPWNPN